MARYVMTHRKASKTTPTQHHRARDKLQQAWSTHLEHLAELIGDHHPAEPHHRRVLHFDAEADDVEVRAAHLDDDIIIEPAITYRHGATGAGTQMRVLVRGDTKGLDDADVALVVLDEQSTPQQFTMRTGHGGACEFQFDTARWTPAEVVVSPAGGFWSMAMPTGDRLVEVDCLPLQLDRPLAWWHAAVGLTTCGPDRGAGISIGVIDTGLGPHPNLTHCIDLGAIIHGDRNESTGADVDVHGTHVSGLIAARPTASGQPTGIAPGATLSTIRVFPPGNQGANQGDVAAAVDELVDIHQTHLINLSIATATRSEIEYDAIRHAYENGTVCICAAGNTGDSVSYPARLNETVAVGAIGNATWGPPGSVAGSLIPPARANRRGTPPWFSPQFSCSGPELDCSAPGVGLISTFPIRAALTAPFADLSGTSCASPVTTAVLACLLADTPAFTSMPRTAERVTFARETLRSSCLDAGLTNNLQGAGIPQVRQPDPRTPPR